MKIPGETQLCEHHRRKAYSEKLIARIKGALRCGFRPKQISYLTGIPIPTLNNWSQEDSQSTVEPDYSIREDLRLALLKEN